MLLVRQADGGSTKVNRHITYYCCASFITIFNDKIGLFCWSSSLFPKPVILFNSWKIMTVWAGDMWVEYIHQFSYTCVAVGYDSIVYIKPLFRVVYR